MALNKWRIGTILNDDPTPSLTIADATQMSPMSPPQTWPHITANLPFGTAINANVSVTWIATGPPVSTTTVDRLDPDVEMFHASERPAVASGTISDGTTNYLPGPTSDAALQTSHSVAITQGPT